MLHCNMTTTMETVMADGKSAPAAPAAKTGVAVAKSAAPAKQTVKQKAKAKVPKPKPQDPLVGRQVKTWYDVPSGQEAQVRGTIMDVKTKKSGKKPGKYYDVAYEQRYGLPNDLIHKSEIRAMLV